MRENDICATVHYICVCSLTCSVDHTLGCCCCGSKNVRCAASSGCSTRGGRAHRVDWQAARRRLFDWNHNAPAGDETQRHQTNLHTQDSLLNTLQRYLGSLCWSVPAGCENTWEDSSTADFSRYWDESITCVSMITVYLCLYNNTMFYPKMTKCMSK